MVLYNLPPVFGAHDRPRVHRDGPDHQEGTSLPGLVDQGVARLETQMGHGLVASPDKVHGWGLSRVEAEAPQYGVGV